MAAVVGYLIVASIAIVAALLVAGPHHVVKRDPTFELDEVSARQVPILGALAGFAVTGVVFLVTQARNVPDASSTSFTTVVTMFVVAYMGYFSSSVLFANVSHRVEDSPFDLAAAQYAGASISLFSVFLGWFALKPLFETFGLTTIAQVTGWLLIGAVVVGYGLLATALYRSGYASARLVRWPFAVPELARRYAAAPDGPDGDAARGAVEVVFATLHRLLGVGIGEHLGYLFTGLWTLLVAGSILSTAVLPAWLGFVGLPIGFALLIGTLEFVGPNERDGWALAGAIVPVAYIAWSVWLIALGVFLLV